jgi:DNA-binding NtrC family response regulator
MGVILVVDDEIEVCNALQEFLAAKGHEVHTAQSGDMAIKIVKELRPDVVLLDIIMPGKWGTDVLKEIHKFDALINVIMLTAIADETEVKKAIKAGAFDYMYKPIDLKKLLGLLSKIVS